MPSTSGSELRKERRSVIALVFEKANEPIRKEQGRDIGGNLGLTVRIFAGFSLIACSVASVISSRGGNDEADGCRPIVGRVGGVMASENE